MEIKTEIKIKSVNLNWKEIITILEEGFSQKGDR